MTDYQEHQPNLNEAPKTVTEVQVGEWFNPFLNYRKSQRKFDPVISVVNLRGVGELQITSATLGKDLLTVNRNVTVMLNDRDMQIDTDEMKRLETDAVRITAECEEKKYIASAKDYFPYDFQVKSPSGNVYTVPFQLSAFADGELFLEAKELGPERRQLFAPETDYILERIETRFVPEGVRQDE